MAKNALNKIESWNDFQRPIAKALREHVLAKNAEMNETVKWGYPCFVHAENNICSIVPHRRHVNLQFFDGAHLKDSDDQLQGRGKRMRHLKFTDVEKIDEEVISDFVGKAINYHDI